MLENDDLEKVYTSFQMWRVGVVYVKFYGLVGHFF